MEQEALEKKLSTKPNSKRWMHEIVSHKRSAMIGKPEWYPHQPPEDIEIRDLVPSAFGLSDYWHRFKRFLFGVLDVW
ncbi:MAG: hypothetical protein QHH15_00335 [Candidatus Thermoplasmatota archaeon]|nr:hypothetical protein [Candidatus Thermoplasmatota archaeon]